MHAAPILLAAVVSAQAADAGAGADDGSYEAVLDACRTLADGNEWDKVGAAGVLGDIPAVYAVPCLASALSDDSLSVRIMAVAALGRIADASAVLALAGAAQGDDALVAAAAVEALGDMHVDASYDALIDLLADVDDPDLKAEVVKGLKKWNKPFTPLPDPEKLPKGWKQPAGGEEAAEKTQKPGKAAAAAKEAPKEPPAAPWPGKCVDQLATGKKNAKTIDTQNPYGDVEPHASPVGKFPCFAGMIDETNPYVEPPAKKIDVDNPYTVSKPAKNIDEKNPYAPPG